MDLSKNGPATEAIARSKIITDPGPKVPVNPGERPKPLPNRREHRRHAPRSTASYRPEPQSKGDALLRRMRDRGRYLPDYRRASTQGNVPAGQDTQVARHPMRTVRTVHTSLRSSNPRIRAAAKAMRAGFRRALATREG